jgi:hypothetical protein
MRRFRIGAAIASALTVGTGLIVLFGLLLTESVERDTALPAGSITSLQAIADILLQITTIIIALTIVLGVLNLTLVHTRRLVTRQRGLIYSAVLLVSFLLVLVTYVTDRETNIILLETVQRPVESALAGVLFFALVYGAYHIMHERVTWANTLFVATLLIVLIAALPLAGLGAFQNLRDWLMEIPVSAGARGLLLGIALATLVTGVRILIGVDRSYRE